MASRVIPTISTMPRNAQRGLVLQAFAAVQAAMRVRATRRLLAEMEPRMLADIGVSRSKAMHEADRVFWDAGALR